MTTPPVTTITDELLAELEQLAGKATPGPWEQIQRTDDGACHFWLIQTVDTNGWELAEVRSDVPESDENAGYLAAANPATILALLQHVRELRVKADRYDWIAKEHNDEHGGIWVAAWDRDKVDWISIDAAFRPENDSDLDLDASVDAARSSTTG